MDRIRTVLTAEAFKQKLRGEVLAARDQLSEYEREKCSRQIKTQLLLHEKLRKAENVFLYASFRSEVLTDSLIQILLDDGKKVALPVTAGNTLRFYLIRSLQELQTGKYRIRVPQEQENTYIVPHRTDVMILPGAVFDRYGNRIGYGGGYYDRYLTGLQEDNCPWLIGISYGIQVYDGVLRTEEQDYPVNEVITENTNAKLP